ncbi:MAG: hypothetical protein Q8O67_17455 [Deltaproteobacteria bacterium]|nr:hypothetical protein [Deltaproteobacteria bacterium]
MRAAAVVVVVVVVVLGFAAGARAAETDPYYAWFAPPQDGTAALNTVINERLERGLAEVNASSPPLSCERAARAMVAPLAQTAWWFFVSEMRLWDVDRVPHDDAGYSDLRAVGTYRSAPLLPFGKFVPVDPAVRVGDVLFGTDKLGHFFTNGPRYLDRYRSALAGGADVAAAEAAAVRLGVAQELGWLGMGVSGVFSYGDLEANWRGFLFFRDLCASPPSSTTPRLIRRDERWSLSAPFDIAAVVSPCWDESFATSAFAPQEREPVRRAVLSLCKRWQRPDIQERRRRYRERGCAGRHQLLLASLIGAGEAPDPRPWSIDSLCSSSAK